ncbi:MAG: DUF4446 family protein [Candidatus Nealsonbacteria bacterium]|nr:DUF4446 family protein [Candidatus Nealsonbacteria bacterium]
MFFSKKTKKEPESLKEVLSILKKLEEKTDKNSQVLEELKRENKKNLQKVGIVRFNPFKEIGGDQSFSMAVLDADNNGFVMTSHYGREANRVYIKQISRGSSSYSLAKDELEALKKAMQ